jgi:hypothetical protein
MFPADDVLAEWAATLALAFNDVSLVRIQMIEDDSVPYRWLYWLRLGVAHFAEAASYIRDTSELPEVAAFIGSLPDEVQAHHAECLARYSEHETVIERIRNEAGFHYPELRLMPGQRRRRPMQKILAALGDQGGSVIGETIGDGRFVFADDVVSSLIVRAHGGDEALLADPMEQAKILGPVHVAIEEAIQSFVLFANGVFNAYFGRKVDGGAEWHVTEDNAEAPSSSDSENSRG